MKYAFAAAAMASAATLASAGAVTAQIKPPTSTPSGCQSTYNGFFTFNTANLTSSNSKRSNVESLQERAVACGGTGALTLTLNNGILLDQRGRTGYIASNAQFQFDGPPQAGAIYTAGWSVCGNGSLALGDEVVFYNCLSGTFNNIYDQSQGGQCYPVTIDTLPCAGTPQGDIVTTPTDINATPASGSSGSATASVPSTTSTSSLSTVSVPSSVPATGTPTPAVAAGNATTPSAATPAKAATFTGAANVVAVGQKILGAAAGLAVAAML